MLRPRESDAGFWKRLGVSGAAKSQGVQMNDTLTEFLLEQIRVKDEEIFRLRVELAEFRAAGGDIIELQLIPCGERVH